METGLVLTKVFALLEVHDRMNCKFVDRQWNALLKTEKYRITTYESEETIRKWIDEVAPTLSYDEFVAYWKVMDGTYKAYVVCHKNAALEELLHVHENYARVDGTWYAKRKDPLLEEREYLNFLVNDKRALSRLRQRFDDEIDYRESVAWEASCFEEDDYDEFDVVGLMRW